MTHFRVTAESGSRSKWRRWLSQEPHIAAGCNQLWCGDIITFRCFLKQKKIEITSVVMHRLLSLTGATLDDGEVLSHTLLPVVMLYLLLGRVGCKSLVQQEEMGRNFFFFFYLGSYWM